MASSDGTSWLDIVRERAGTVRVRTTLGATAVLGLSLIIASVALVMFVRGSLTEDVRTAIQVEADSLQGSLVHDIPPDVLANSDGEDRFVQILNSGGRVIASTENMTGAPAPPDGVWDRDGTEVDVPFDDDPFLAIGETTDDGRVAVVGRSLDNVLESSSTLTGVLLIGIPLLLVFAGAVAWRLVGKALSPVEAIRSQVESISMEDLHRRVPSASSPDEVGRLAATMNRMLGRLEEGRARERRFVSDASHELRSPIAIIRQHAEVAVAHPESTSTRDLAELVMSENARLQRLVEDLLLLARMDEDRSAARREPVDLDDIVLGHLDRIRTGNGKILDSSAVSAGRVMGDRRQLHRMVANLVDNALRHSKNEIAVSLGEHDGHVVLTVDDDGAGIPPADRRRIFQRFVRLEEARDRDSGGAGLGLAIVAEVALKHGGVARATGSPLGGSHFEVRLPRSS